MSRLVGIDLGTTFSAIALLDDIGKPEIVPNADGDRITPSVVYFPEDEPGKSLVGDVAKKSAAYCPGRVIQHVKRKMGSDDEYKLDGKSYSPTEISSLILKKLVQEAAQQKGEIGNAVITVPANFLESARKATMDAGELAGLEVSHIINEPTAAGLFYAATANVSGRVLIYDLGGGTFDVTVADIANKEVRVVTSLGDQHLGGADFDRKILEILQERYQEKYGKPLFSDDAGSYAYLADAEELKKTLSKRPKAGVMVNGEAGPLKVEIERADFEEAISTYVAKTVTLIDGVLDEARCQASDIDHVLLVGGSTRVPLIERTLASSLGKAPTRSVNVDEAVALGAAIYAGLKAPRRELNAAQCAAIAEIKITDVCNSFFGTISVDVNPTTGRHEHTNAIILERNTPLPTSNTKSFQTLGDGQMEIECTVTQSQFPETDPEFVNVIDKAMFTGLPANRAAGCEIQITFSYDVNERMHCVFLDVESGLKHEAVLKPEGSSGSGADRDKIRDFTVE